MQDLKAWLPVSSHSANIVQRNAFRGHSTKYKFLENFALYGNMQTSKNYYSKWCGDEAKIYVRMMFYITDGVMFSWGFLVLCFLVFPRPILANVVELYNNYYIIKNYNSVNTLFRQNVQ